MIGIEMDRKTLSPLTLNQEKMRERLVELFYKNPQSVRSMSVEMGVTSMTLHNFLVRGRGINSVTAAKILAFLESKEKKSAKRAPKKIDKKRENE